MPTYEYRCGNGHLFERFQRMSEAPIGSCPECGAPAERLLSAGAGLLFKGSGFYITDYRSDSYRKAAQAESGGDGGKAGGDGAKSGGEAKSGGDAAKSGGDAPRQTGGESGKGSTGGTS